ncbi:MAG: hypothetical protein ACLRXQ_07700 [Phascolarctobacterium faecium]
MAGIWPYVHGKLNCLLRETDVYSAKPYLPLRTLKEAFFIQAVAINR